MKLVKRCYMCFGFGMVKRAAEDTRFHPPMLREYSLKSKAHILLIQSNAPHENTPSVIITSHALAVCTVSP